MPGHVGKPAGEFHSASGVLGEEGVGIFDEEVGVEQFVWIFVGVGSGRSGTAEVAATPGKPVACAHFPVKQSIEVLSGILWDESEFILRTFFGSRRIKTARAQDLAARPQWCEQRNNKKGEGYVLAR